MQASENLHRAGPFHLRGGCSQKRANGSSQLCCVMAQLLVEPPLTHDGTGTKGRGIIDPAIQSRHRGSHARTRETSRLGGPHLTVLLPCTAKRTPGPPLASAPMNSTPATSTAGRHFSVVDDFKR